jgi:Domain of unknown function (DUF4383)
MAPRLHLPHRRMPTSAHSEERPGLGARVYAVQRTGAVLVALFLLVFALLGFASGQAFFSTRGTEVLGMTSNGLLSTLSVVVAVVLLVAAMRSPRTASTVMLVLGPLFLLSALVNSMVLGTGLNWLAFEMSNVIFSVVVGLPMLLLGAYGRIGSHLPPDSPYAHPNADYADFVDESPHTQEEATAEEAMREAEIAVVEHTATPDQYRRVHAMGQAHHRMDRRRVWMELDASGRQRARHDVIPRGHGVVLPHPRAGWHVPWRRAGPGRG